MSTTVQAGREASREGEASLAISFSKVISRRLLLSLSIANLCFTAVWTEVIGVAAKPSARYFQAQAPDIKLVWALILDVVILAAVIFFGFVLRDRQVRTLKLTGTVLIGFFCLFALYQLQRSFNAALEGRLPGHALEISKFSFAAISLFLLVRFGERLKWAVRALFLVFSPLLPILAVNGLVLYSTVDLREAGKGRAAGMLPVRPNANRVIWIIFDELDQGMVFDARPNRIQLHEFDRLRAESIYADHVKTPAPDTVLSIPALLTGQVVTKVKLSTSKLLVKTNDRDGWKDLSSEPNIFSRARAAGFNTAVSGWHHPYARLIGNSLSECSWDICPNDVYSIMRFLRDRPVYYNAFYLAGWQAYQVPFLYGLGWADSAPQLHRVIGQAHISVTQFVTANGARMLRNRDLNLAFLHIPIPHLPGVWNVKSQAFTTGNSNYVDNLQLADKLLGDVRAVLENTEDWNGATILVSSDHPYRTSYWGAPDAKANFPTKAQPYVPFLLKMPGQHVGVAYHREFNNIVSADLLLDALEGKVRTTSQALTWLSSRAQSSAELKQANCPESSN